MLLPRSLLIFIFVCSLTLPATAQNLLNKTVSLDARRQPLSQVLNSISKQGNFYFSYLSTVIPQDSIVSISVKNKTVKQVLDMLFTSDYVYKESGNYIIILRRSNVQSYYQISGVVTDKHTGQRLANASVYERTQLISTLTNSDGYFRLRLRDKYPAAAISVSKDLYADTSVMLTTGKDQEIDISISPATYQLKTVDITAGVEKRWFGKMFLSSRQKLTSMNIGGFFADKPYQISLTPGLGSHGRMSGQVVNKFSYNVVGGYAGGVDGLEIGHVFNIVKGDVQYVQVAGVFNIVGGKTRGVQLAGFHNNVIDSMKGVQVAGFSNITEGSLEGVQVTGAVGQVYKNLEGVQVSGAVDIVRGNVDGWQVGGVLTWTGGNTDGAQLSGALNINKNTLRGLQAAGVANVNGGTMKGVQVATLFNYAKRVDGIQIGLINVADTVTGYSIGIINIVRRGYKKVVLFSTDVMPFNLAWKAGRKELYSIVTGGISPDADNKSWSLGYGIGKEITFNKRLSLTGEFTVENVFLGKWDRDVQVFRLQPSLQVQVAKWIRVFAGPSLAFSSNNSITALPGYRSPDLGAHYPSFWRSDDSRSWLGWQAGISLF